MRRGAVHKEVAGLAFGAVLVEVHTNLAPHSQGKCVSVRMTVWLWLKKPVPKNGLPW